MFKNINVTSRSLSPFVLLFVTLLSASCGFAYKKHVVGRYYIIGVDTRFSLSLSYEHSPGNYSGKAPGNLIQYGYNDSFLVALTEDNAEAVPNYYIIDMTKDSELAHEETFRIGPLSTQDFDSLWKRKLAIEMKLIQ